MVLKQYFCNGHKLPLRVSSFIKMQSSMRKISLIDTFSWLIILTLPSLVKSQLFIWYIVSDLLHSQVWMISSTLQQANVCSLCWFPSLTPTTAKQSPTYCSAQFWKHRISEFSTLGFRTSECPGIDHCSFSVRVNQETMEALLVFSNSVSGRCFSSYIKSLLSHHWDLDVKVDMIIEPLWWY